MDCLSQQSEILTRKAAGIFRAINHDLRREILRKIGDGEIDVSTLYKSFKIEQSIMSAHLKILRDAGFVKGRREGKNIYYSRVNERFQQVLNVSNKLICES